jgi:hypothetical protein
VNGFLEEIVRLLNVAVFVPLAGIVHRGLHAVVSKKVAVPGVEAATTAAHELVGGCREVVGTMLRGYRRECLQSTLDALHQSLEALRTGDRLVLPVGVGQDKVIQEVWKTLSADGDPERVHLGEVRLSHFSRYMLLGEEDLLLRPTERSPVADAALERANLPRGKPPRVEFLELFEDRLRLKIRRALQKRLHFGPDTLEGISASAPVVLMREVPGQSACLAVLPGGPLTHRRLRRSGADG